MEKLAVLFGGKSPEYEVSLQSASAVIKALQNKYEIYPIGIDIEGEWHLFQGDINLIKQNKWLNSTRGKVIWSMNPKDQGFYVLTNEGQELVQVDGVFPVLHGKNGEDGTIQGMIEISEVPLIGCGMESSVVCMNKRIAHNLVLHEGIKVPRSVMIDQYSIQELKKSKYKLLNMQYPLFVKPMRAGSSFGITKITNKDQLQPAIEKAFLYDDIITIEENIAGFEVGCAILGDTDLTSGRVDEIELNIDFFDYYEKYHQETTRIHMPARISEELENKIIETGVRIYRVLGCKGFARIDMFLTPDNEIVFNEVNTIPGLVELSRFPKMMQGIGLEFAELMQKIVEIELEEQK